MGFARYGQNKKKVRILNKSVSDSDPSSGSVDFGIPNREEGFKHKKETISSQDWVLQETKKKYQIYLMKEQIISYFWIKPETERGKDEILKWEISQQSEMQFADES